MLKVRIDYLNKDKQVRHSFVNIWEVYDGIYEVDDIWFEIVTLLKQWATDIRIYNLIK